MYNGHENIVKMLYKTGANINIRNNFGMNTLQMCTFNTVSNLNTMKLLLQWGCDVNVVRGSSQSALLLATLNVDVQAVELLLASGADPNCVDKAGMTPLEAAIRSGNCLIVKMLLQANAQVYTCEFKHSLFEFALQITSCNELGLMVRNSAAMMSREGWFFTKNMPDGLTKNALMEDDLKAFARDFVLEYLQGKSILHTEVMCGPFNHQCRLQKDFAKLAGYVWHCSKCKKKQSVLKDSFIEGAKTAPSKFLYLVYYWVMTTALQTTISTYRPARVVTTTNI